MKESLVKIKWSIESEFDNSDYTIELDIDNDESIVLSLEGIDSNASYFLNEIGTDILDEVGYKMIKDYIKKERNPDLESIDFLRNPDWEAPKNGECIMVIKISSWQSNHPMDPQEWDTDIDCLGILGEEVKLTY